MFSRVMASMRMTTSDSERILCSDVGRSQGLLIHSAITYKRLICMCLYNAQGRVHLNCLEKLNLS